VHACAGLPPRSPKPPSDVVGNSLRFGVISTLAAPALRPAIAGRAPNAVAMAANIVKVNALVFIASSPA